MGDEFRVHKLNAKGLQAANELGEAFATLLAKVESMIPKTREYSLVVTKLQEASFFAKRAIAQNPENQE